VLKINKMTWKKIKNSALIGLIIGTGLALITAYYVLKEIFLLNL